MKGLATWLKYILKLFTAWKVSVFGVILVRIFSHLDWIRRDTEYLYYLVQIRENAGPNNIEHGHFLRSALSFKV